MSSAVMPYSRSAAAFQLVMRPDVSSEKIASAETCTTWASRSRSTVDVLLVGVMRVSLRRWWIGRQAVRAPCF